MPTIKIQRPVYMLGRFRKFKIYLDENKIGTVSSGDTQEFNITAGQHKIYCKQDMFNTPFTYDFNISENETKTFIVQYKNKPMMSIILVLGFIVSAMFSQWLPSLLNISQNFWIAFYIVFVVIILFTLKATKQFVIDIHE